MQNTFSDLKLRNFRGILRKLPESGCYLLSKYTSRYFGATPSAMPVVHAVIAISLIGYAIKYPGLKAASHGEHH